MLGNNIKTHHCVSYFLFLISINGNSKVEGVEFVVTLGLEHMTMKQVVAMQQEL